MLARYQLSFSTLLSTRYSSTITTASRSKWNLSGQKAPRSILDDDTLSFDLTEDADVVNGSRLGTPLHRRAPSQKSTPQEYISHRRTIAEAFPEGWSPPRKLSREAMEGLRQLHAYDKATFTTSLLADKFRISPEAVRRILKSKWEPSKEKREKMIQKHETKRSQSLALNRMKEQEEANEVEQIRREQRGRHKRSASEDSLLFG